MALPREVYRRIRRKLKPSSSTDEGRRLSRFARSSVLPPGKTLAQAEFISAEHLKSVRAPKMAPSILGVTQKQLDELHIALVKPQE